MTKIIFLLATVMLLSACGSNSIIQSITVSSVVDTEQNQWVNLDSKIKMGSLQFPALTLPILNPKNSSELLGKVSLAPGVDGLNLLSIQANLNQLKNNALTQDRLLPNGALIPIAGMEGVVSIKINERSKIYIGANATQFLVGLALVIPAFDSIGNYIPGASLFLPLPKESKVDGVAGAFTGAGSGQNGLGLFILTPNTIPLNKNKATTLAMRTPASKSKASVVVSDESSSKSNSLKRSLYIMSLQSQVLTVE
jgi:hypothetical protein